MDRVFLRSFQSQDKKAIRYVSIAAFPLLEEFAPSGWGEILFLTCGPHACGQEPNPADDLNGADVARKLTILSRYIPSLRDKLPDGYKSVSTKSLVPAALDGLQSGDEFIKKLSDYDQEFDKLRSDAFKESKVLRFVGVIDVASGVIKADLERWVLNWLQRPC